MIPEDYDAGIQTRYVKTWTPLDPEPTKKFYDHNNRGITVYIHNTDILDWMRTTQPRNEWTYDVNCRYLTMTAKVYTMFLLKYGNL
jgi:hypothetical protein